MRSTLTRRRGRNRKDIVKPRGYGFNVLPEPTSEEPNWAELLAGLDEPKQSHEELKTGADRENWPLSAFQVGESTREFTILQMQFVCHPTPRDCRYAVILTLEALRSVHLAHKERSYHAQRRIDALEVRGWSNLLCKATFRTSTVDNRIHATYSLPQHRLELSLPSAAIWNSCGLEWFGKHSDCCELARNNPAPWDGPSCHCAKDDKR
jgi:hypothetical protein